MVSLQDVVDVDFTLVFHEQKLLVYPIANILDPYCWITVIDDKK